MRQDQKALFMSLSLPISAKARERRRKTKKIRRKKKKEERRRRKKRGEGRKEGKEERKLNQPCIKLIFEDQQALKVISLLL